jgi:hypothetical protein
MRAELLDEIKFTIEATLKKFLRHEGIALHIAANDNKPPAVTPLVALESICDMPLSHNSLLSEIRVVLNVLGKPWQCNVLINGIYEALQPHCLSQLELTVLLMSLHAESVEKARPLRLRKRTVVRYIVEEVEAGAHDDEVLDYLAEEIADA